MIPIYSIYKQLAYVIYYLYPYTPSVVRPARIYSDTTLVFYKPDTVSSSCGGNGVRNWRTKSRRV